MLFAPDTEDVLEFDATILNTAARATRSGVDQLATTDQLAELMTRFGFSGRFDGDEAELDDLDLDVDGSITIAEWGLPLVHAVDAWLHVEIVRTIGGEDVDEPRTVRLTGHGDRWPAARLLAFARGTA